MPKSPDAFRTISEVAEWLDIQAHVLRFWESKFTQVKPIKRAGGRRYYRPDDMLLLGGIKKLLHDDGLTIKGVQKILREDGMNHVASLSAPLDELSQVDLSADHEDSFDMPARPKEDPLVPEPENVVLPFEPVRSPPSDTAATETAAPPDMPAMQAEAKDQPAEETPESDVPEAGAPHSTAPEETAPEETTSDAAAPTPPEVPEPAAPVTIEQDDATPVNAGTDGTAEDASAKDKPEPDTGEDEAQELPTFLRQPLAERSESTPAASSLPDDASDHQPPEADVPQDPVPAAPKPRVIDLPPVPAEDQIAASPGALSAVLSRQRLSSEAATQARQLIVRLQALSDLLGNAPQPPAKD